MRDNPYQSPRHEPAESAEAAPPGPAAPDPAYGISTVNTVVPRYIAAMLDNALALILGVVAAKSVTNDWPVLQLLAMVTTYLGYYFVSEGFLSRTPGKLLTGLVVVQVDGRPCSWGQILIRTGFRVLEVNPAILGAIPAALCIIFSGRHQRFGDMVAHTIVVPPGRLPRKRTRARGRPISPAGSYRREE